MSETNNAHIPIAQYKRDPTYYHSDGNIVFLVGGVLFKVYALLILPAGSISSTTRDAGQRYPLGVEDLPATLTDSSDTCPIVLPNITPTQFRNYLLALLGRIYDPEYCSLFTDDRNRKKHTRSLLVRLLDIADVSHGFGMSKLEAWAFSRLESVLESVDEQAESIWDKGTILRLHSCARSSGRATFASLAVNFIQYFISTSTVPEGEDTQNEHVSLNLDTCIQLFKDTDLLDGGPALFGCAFASILALGHRSAAWTTGITGSQRAMLYAAQVQLTAPSKDPRRSNAYPNSRPDRIVHTCEQCHSQFGHSWDTSFGKYRELKSAGSFQGLTALARLPQYRRLFSTKFTRHEPGTSTGRSDYMVGFFTDPAKDHIFNSRPICQFRTQFGVVQAGTGETTSQCTGPEWPIGYLDSYIQLVYQDLAALYKNITSHVGLVDRTLRRALTFTYPS